jgi:hypothetical protein
VRKEKATCIIQVCNVCVCIQGRTGSEEGALGASTSSKTCLAEAELVAWVRRGDGSSLKGRGEGGRWIEGGREIGGRVLVYVGGWVCACVSGVAGFCMRMVGVGKLMCVLVCVRVLALLC